MCTRLACIQLLNITEAVGCPSSSDRRSRQTFVDVRVAQLLTHMQHLQHNLSVNQAQFEHEASTMNFNECEGQTDGITFSLQHLSSSSAIQQLEANSCRAMPRPGNLSCPEKGTVL